MNAVCTVSAGPYDEVRAVAGRTVAHVRSHLRQLFNIPECALAVCNGDPVEEEFVLPPGARLEFLNDAGFKGLGALLTPDEIQRRWNISEAQYRELCEMGLPTIRLSGTDRHPEVAVDEWFRSRGTTTEITENHPTPQPAPKGKPGRKATTKDIAVFVNELKAQKKTWKEMFVACKRAFPGRITSQDQVRSAWERHFKGKQ
jgi:hypothetical protein